MDIHNDHSESSSRMSLPVSDSDMPKWGENCVTQFVVLVLPGFSQLSLAAFIEPFRLANLLAESDLFGWRTVSLDGKTVECASKISVGVTGSLADVEASLNSCVNLVLCAGENVEQYGSASLRGVLRRIRRARKPVFTLGTATWLLADAAVLGKTRCTVHWGRRAPLSETFEGLSLDDALFVRDGEIVTCAGEFAAFDLAIDIIQRRCGVSLANSICQHVAADRWRDGDNPQAVPPDLRYSGAGTRLLPIIKLMEANLENPLSLHEISRQATLSRRQIERLFKRHLSRTPLEHYVTLRLAKARQLVEVTGMPIMDIAIACGFVSSSHFTKTFRDHFRRLPTELRVSALFARQRISSGGRCP